MLDTDNLLWALDFFYYRDKMNACLHCSPVRFSEITKRLAIEYREYHIIEGTYIEEILAQL